MNNLPPHPGRSWKRSRLGFAAFWFCSLLAGWLVLRLALFFSFKPSGLPLADVALAFLSGLHRDILVGLLLTLPILCWVMLVRDVRPARPWHRTLFWSACFLFWFVQIFMLFVEGFFFEEFKSRFNTVAVDYVLYPREVFVNIWESYHVGLFVLICVGLSIAWLLAARKLFGQMWTNPCSRKARVLGVLLPVALAALLLPMLNLRSAHVGNDRTLNEIANNGAISFFAAAWTHHLDYGAFYKTLPKAEAYERVRRLVSEPSAHFVEAGASIRRDVAGDPARPQLNVVLFLEESLGSEFWGCLGRKGKTLTPEMDKLAAEEGLLFTNIYACGNRTVRGMEGVLSSFPPLPGDSIVKRDLSENVETIARVLKRDGYATLFLYGGRGLFDGMRGFTVHNGYDRFIEQKHFAHPTFTTAWGVCDEDIFDRGIEEFRALSRTNQPFFATLLSVSNHKPYAYPLGRIPEAPRGRDNAVKYSDYALGKFFRAAKQEAFWTNTIFVVIADHGDRVYGKQSIPIHSYEIPLLIAGPAAVKAPARIPQLGSSLDVSPTILGLIGRPYESMFFGHDLLKCRPEDGRAFLNHNRDIGMLAHDRLVVLGLLQNVEFYQGNPKVVDMNVLATPADSDRELENDTIAVYQVADELYTHRHYRIDEK